MTVLGHVRYERLVLGPLGLGPALEVRPARHVDVQIRVSDGGPCYGQTTTDGDGRFEVEVRPPAGSVLRAWVLSRTHYDPTRRITVHDGLPPRTNVHLDLDVFHFVGEAFSGGGALDLLVPYRRGKGDRPSIGFAILDVLLTCDASLRSSAPQADPESPQPPALPALPPCHAYTRVGNNGATGTSLYLPAIGALSLLGGAAGIPDGSDTDYFDDAVIAHEYGHFVESALVHTLSRGGDHGGVRLEPGLAWSEGQATAFGCLCRGDSRYVDTLTTTGGTAFDLDIEDIPQAVRGIGSEETVAELVWDLGDGIGEIEDLDGDGVGIPVGRLYAAFLSFDAVHEAPYVGLLLDRLVERREIGVGMLQGLLTRPENQGITYPLEGEDRWPEPLAWGDLIVGTVDATGANPCRALEASRWYRFEVETPLSVSIEFLVTPFPGLPANAEIALLDVGGRSIRTRRVEASGPGELGPVPLEAGTFIVRVSAGCVPSGTRVAYRLMLRGS